MEKCGRILPRARYSGLFFREQKTSQPTIFLFYFFHFLYSEFMDQANILIIGGGVIGCAIANAVSKLWQHVFLVEQLPKLGMPTSTRNSGVNHSRIHNPKNSLTTPFCAEGNRL